MTARSIYEVLSKQRFRDFYEGAFAEHLEDSSVKTGVTKNEVQSRIEELFKPDNPYNLDSRDKVLALVQSFNKKQVGAAVRIVNPEDKIRTTLVFEDWAACIRCGETLKSLNAYSVIDNMSCQSNNDDYDGNSVICLFWK